jgi:predicted nucleic acid-binding protein
LAYLLDTDVIIHWRDGNVEVRSRIIALAQRPQISAISRVELENGVYRDPDQVETRRNLLDALLRRLNVIDFTDETAVAFSKIVAKTGFSRRKTNDRMIAATALVHDLTLITMNGDDFLDVPGLQIEIW